MDLPVNQFKKRLLKGEIQYGLWLGLPDATCAEICAQADFDWMLIDAEHAPFSLQKVQEILRTLAAYPVSTLVRPVSDETNLLKQYLDIGVQTLLIPMVESAEQAKRLVQDVRYSPEGSRGLGTSLVRAARWNNVPNYLHNANKEICLMVQVETQAGLDNLNGICQVDGIDAVFIGPSDLSASLGYIGNAENPDVVKIIGDALRTIRAVGKVAGLLSMEPELTKHYVACGASFIGCAVDTLILSNGTKTVANSFRNSNVPQMETQASYNQKIVPP